MNPVDARIGAAESAKGSVPSADFFEALPAVWSADPLAGRTLRACTSRRLVAFPMLSQGQRSALVKFEQQPDLFGVSLPLEENDSVKVVDQRTADLLDGLRGACRSDEVHRRFPGASGDELLLMVFDGLIEVATAGGYVSGVDAHRELVKTANGGLEDSALTELSRQAVRYATLLPETRSRMLSSRLYAFNTAPVRARWRACFASAEKHRAACGLSAGQSTAQLLVNDYQALEVRSWLAWSHRGRWPALEGASTPRHKLYVSPHPDALPATFRTVARCLCELATPSFKIGSDLRGVLRPDKIVAHFETRDELRRAARVLAEHLAGTPAQGVPFTAPLGTSCLPKAAMRAGRKAASPVGAGVGASVGADQRRRQVPDGERGEARQHHATGQDDSIGLDDQLDLLLSRGVDPPMDSAAADWRGLESWRAWVCNELASGIVAARRCETDPERVSHFATDRLRLQGVDPKSWIATSMGEEGSS